MSSLPRAERLEVMRQYRLQREAQKKHDFSQGPPDLSGLRPERLAILRQYRQYLQAQDGAFGPNTAVYAAEAARTVPAGLNVARVDDLVSTPRNGETRRRRRGTATPRRHRRRARRGGGGGGCRRAQPGMAAGVVSGAHGTMYTYFERPVTARERHISAESEPEVAPSPRKSVYVELESRAEALAGAAGRFSTAGTTAWDGAWLENNGTGTPRHCRRLIRKEGDFEASTQRIFAPELAPDEAKAEANRQLAMEQRAARQRRQADELANKMLEAETGAVAGVATVLEDLSIGADAPPTPRGGAGATNSYLTEYMHAAGASTPRGGRGVVRGGGGEMPSTVGLSRRAELEAKKQWRLQLTGMTPGPTAGVAGAPGGIAGMSSEFRSRTVRGQVGTLDPSSAADYNLQVKLARADAQATPRGRGQAAPSFVGDDGAAPANPLADMSNANHLAGLSHAEKLKRMRELRQASMGTPRAAAATEM